MAFIVSTLVSPLNDRLPETISYKIAPKLKRSDRLSAACPLTCSGDIYPTVPITMPAAVGVGLVSVAVSPTTPAGGSCFANPKSRIFTRWSRVMKMFSGFKSR